MVRRDLIRSLLWIAVAIGCRGESAASKQASTAKEPLPATRVLSSPVATAPGTSSQATADTACPTWGDWQPCSVEYRLVRAGLLLRKRDEPVRHAFMRVPGVEYDVSNARIEVFFYKSAQERALDTDQLDPETVSPRGGQPQIWREPATLAISNNLAAIILSVNARQSERIALALEAGQSPTPPPKR